MRILVVCGAGASSTFVAQRVRLAAHRRGLTYTAVAATEQSLAVDLDLADVVLVGPHLADAFERIARESAGRGAVAILLPDDVFADQSGARTLDLVEAVWEGHRASGPAGAARGRNES